MALDYENNVSLGIMAGTLAQWLKDNPEANDIDDNGFGDADEFGMRAMATGFLRMYYELMQLGEIVRLDQLKPDTDKDIN